MAEAQLLYIATSKIKEIRKGASVSYQWGSYGPWTKFKSPVAKSKTKIAYNKTTKNKITGKGVYGGLGGVTVLGSKIPATATRVINGVSRVCEVRYYKRGATLYERTATLKKQKKMLKYLYNSTKPYQYRLQYKDAPKIIDKNYSEYRDSMEFVYFTDYYINDSNERVATEGHIPHPTKFNVTFSDCRRNFTSSANNSDNRDNSGSYVLSNVRANIVTIDAEWEGLEKDEGVDLINTLNPSKDTKGQYPYLTLQFINPATGAVTNKTFFAGDRKVEMFPSGAYKSISCTFTEV